METKALIFLSPEVLWLHPENIRLYYPDQDVAEMAESIRAHEGVVQALLIAPIAARPGHYHVIDGNLRLTAAKRLGADCPPLKCEILEMDHVAQLLAMATTSERVYPKDPISKGRHYRRLVEQEALEIEEIAARMGCSISNIYNYLRYLDLDEPIQQLIIERKLNTAPRALQLLMRVPDAATRLDLAQRFARNKTTGRGIMSAVAHVLRQLRQVEQVEVKTYQPRPAAPLGNGRLSPAKIWDIAGKTLCEGCRVNQLGQKCWVCPGPYEFIQHLVEIAEFAVEADND